MYYHIHIDIPSVLKRWGPEQWHGNCRNEHGAFMSPDEVKETFKANLEIGIVAMPVCDESECPNFNYHGGGCPGHEES